MRKSPNRSTVTRNAGEPLAAATLHKIEAARRRLFRASSVLTCLATAVDGDMEFDVADVAVVVRDIIDSSIDALDSVRLRSAGVRD